MKNVDTKEQVNVQPPLLEREPFLAVERSEAEFNEYVKVVNCDSLIEDVDFESDVIVA